MTGWMQSVDNRINNEIPKWRNSIKLIAAKRLYQNIVFHCSIYHPSHSYFKYLTTVTCDILYYFQNNVKYYSIWISTITWSKSYPTCSHIASCSALPGQSKHKANLVLVEQITRLQQVHNVLQQKCKDATAILKLLFKQFFHNFSWMVKQFFVAKKYLTFQRFYKIWFQI